MGLFETVKNNVTTCQAAERYGLRVGHNGMCKCPLHNDKYPSMKLDRRYHCFGCQADDFFIRYDAHDHVRQTRKRYEPRAEDILAHKVTCCFRELAAYYN